MTREDIIRLAREAGICMENSILLPAPNGEMEALERFAALVIARREAQSIHTCPPDCQKPLCVNRRREVAAAVEAEREACAQVAEAWDADHPKTNYGLCIGNAIRARGSK
jgi:hypothetical protein